MSLGAAAPQALNPRDALWGLVHDECVPEQLHSHDPRPCVEVDLRDGVEKGFAVLKDMRGATQFLLIPTARVPGIESPARLGFRRAELFCRCLASPKIR